MHVSMGIGGGGVADLCDVMLFVIEDGSFCDVMLLVIMFAGFGCGVFCVGSGGSGSDGSGSGSLVEKLK